MGVTGNADGTGAIARFSNPAGLAVDGAGNLYVADRDNATIRKITVAGAVTTLAGLANSSGSADGTGSAARFSLPEAVTVDAAGNVWVACSGDGWIRKITPAGVVTTLARLDGNTAIFTYGQPAGIAVDGFGNVFVADGLSKIYKITPAGVGSVLAGGSSNGSRDGIGAEAQFLLPRGLTIDSAGNLYVTDAFNMTIRRIKADGVVTTLGGLAGQAGSADGTGSAARFAFPRGITMDSTGAIYVADTTNNLIRKGVIPTGAAVAPVFSVQPSDKRVAAGTAVTFVASASGNPEPTYQWRKNGAAINGATSTYYTIPVVAAADTGNYTVVATNSATSVTSNSATLVVDDAMLFTTLPGTDIQYLQFYGIALDSLGVIYVAIPSEHVIKKITGAGVITTFAGTAGALGSNDGVGTAARFFGPYGIAMDRADNLYVADRENHLIRKITSTGVVTTFAGLSGNPGSTDGVGSAARFFQPVGVTVDSAGNVYVAEQGTGNDVRKITPGGAVTTVTGSAGFGAVCVAIDLSGNLYLAGGSEIRKITSNGVVTAFAGNGGLGSRDGVGTEAQFGQIRGITVDGTGNLYVLDSANATIRKVTADGVVTTVGGVARISGSTDGLGNVARFRYPSGITMGSTGVIYIADSSNYGLNNAIRLGALPSLPVITTQPLDQSVLVGLSATFTVAASGYPLPTYQWQKNGVSIAGATGSSYTIPNLAAADAGNYTVVTANFAGSVTSSAVVLTAVIVAPSNAVITITVE